MPKPRPIKIGLISLGCPKNLVDSELMLGAVAKAGFVLTADVRNADVIVINTCAFIQPAKQEAIDTALRAAELRRNGRCRALIMAGCLPQRYPQQLAAELTEVDAFMGLNEIPHIAEIVRQTLHRTPKPQLYYSGPARYLLDAEAPRLRLTPPHYAYLKIADGCSNPCSFCSIPRIRGKYRSRPLEDVLKEARRLVAEGVREINLISQDTTRYGLDIGTALPALLRQLQAIPGEFWIRILYTHPAHWSDELIQTIAACPKVCKYADIPLQHINDAILTAMRRRTTAADIRRLIARLREALPDIAIRTTFLVGFPGETGAQFDELLAFVREMKFTRVGAFAFSPEDGTAASKLPDQVPARERQRRRRLLMATQQAVSRDLLRQMIGRKIRVLMDAPGVGRSAMDAPEIDGKVLVRGTTKTGEFVSVRVNGATEYDLKGEATT
ncbi:MAG: 30S ribosomal protein S12 methylthiotransferase RimO [Verrucomicrobiae bacterium]|nr:30S ribosomal protein S12 methylthiotransferase RimO [Verrucomicrobiae bacterium]